MRKLLYLGFCLVLVAGFGCAITDYGVITDNNQSQSGGDLGAAINTTGKAHIHETSQIATIWPDGTDELINFVDQKADGTGTLTTYNNFSTGGSDPTFHDDLYCNPDWNGCSIFTAPDDNGPNLFDGSFNTNCSGARSLSILLSTGRYYGECGRIAPKFSMDDKISMINSALKGQAFGRNGFVWNVNSLNTTFTARNLETGASYFIPMFGVNIKHFFSESGNVAFSWLDHAMMQPMMGNFSSMLENELNSEAVEVTVTINGVSGSFTIAGGANDVVKRGFKFNRTRF